MRSASRPFKSLFALPTRNGLTRPKAVRGSGVKMVNMGELFAFPRLRHSPMDRAPLSDDEAERFLLEPGDLLFARQSLVLEGAGKCAIFLADNEPVTFESHVTRVRLDQDKANPLFYFYYFQSGPGRDAIRSIVEQGAGAAGIRGSDLALLDVSWRPLPDQDGIAQILGTLDDKIELNRRMNETLEAIARAIFNSWFVDFDPVRAKASGEPPESICRRLGLTPDLLALFPDRLVDSELGEIPEGWEWSSIGREVSVRGGATPSTSNEQYWRNGEFAWVTPKDLAGSAATVLTRSERRITAAAVKKISSGQLPRGTVLLSSRAPIGYVALAMIPVSINQGFIAMVCDGRLPNTYVLQWTLENIAAIKQRAGGTTFAEISKGNFRPMPILVPDDRVLQSFDQFAAPLYEKVAASVKECDALAETRDSLLPRLISGELRVPLEGAA